MAKVRLGDVVMRIKDKVNRDNCDLDYYIGGEHFDYGEVLVTKRAEIQGSTIGPAFHMRFHKGDVLLMSRNPHLRKAGMVDFVGLCSDVSYVCRTRDEGVLLQEFLPFLFQTDDFWKFAEANKKGSTNFFLNWSDFEKYEFDLPDIETQRQLSTLLWAMERTKTAYKNLIAKTEELVKSQFVEMFGDPVSNAMAWQMRPLKETCTLMTGNTPSRAVKEYYGSHIEWIKSDNITNSSLYLTTAAESLSEKGAEVGRVVHPGAILMTCIAGSLNTIGNVAIVDRDVAFNQQINAIIPHQYDTLFLCYLLKLLKPKLHEAASSALKCILNKGNLEAFTAIVPDMALQKEFSSFVAQSDKSKFAAQQALADLTATQKALMRQYLG